MNCLILANAVQVTAAVGLPVVLVSVFVAAYRLMRGPSAVDRALALDLISILAIGMLGLHALAENNAVFLDVAIVVALVSFLATLGFARYLTRGLAERDPDHD